MTVDGLPLAIQPEPWQTSYNYDRYGRLQKISDARAHSSGSFVYAYETGTGLLEQIDSPWQQAGQADYLRQTRSHDNFGRLTSIKTVGSDNADLMGVVNIAYDPLDRRDGLSLFGGSLYASQQARDYDYDAFGQLKQQQSDSLITQEYEYDPIGNRLNYWEGDPLSVTPTTYTPNSLNQYEAYTPEGSPLTEPVYDDDGNLQEGANWTYTWNTENRLTQITKQDNTTQLRFIYDGLGRRVQKEVYAGDGSGAQSSWTLLELNQFIYDGWNMIAQLDTLNPSAPTVHSTYTWGLDLSGSPQGAGGVGGLLSVVDKTGSTFYPSYDFNGNVVGYFDTNTETLVAEFEYGPFGELIRATGSKKDDFNFKFSTKYEDAETGFLYYGFRYYDATTGRWLNRDPIAENGGLNLYGMVGNNPISRWDYLGLMCPEECAKLREQLQNRLKEAERQFLKYGLYNPNSSSTRSVDDFRSRSTFVDAAGTLGGLSGAFDTIASQGNINAGPLAFFSAATFTVGYGNAVGTAVGEGLYGTPEGYARARNEVIRQGVIYTGSAGVGATIVKYPTPVTVIGGLVLLGGEAAISEFINRVDDSHARDLRDLDEYWYQRNRDLVRQAIDGLNNDIADYNKTCIE